MTRSTVPITMTCGCRKIRAGFTEVNGWWVCASCGFPTALYFRAMLRDKLTPGDRNRREVRGVIGYVKFEGGPLDQYVYATETLLGDKGLELPVFEYLWTSAKVTSDKTGAVAQVWKHRSLVTGAPDRPDPATVAALATNEPRAASPVAPPQPVAATPAPPAAPTPQPAAPAASVEAPAADNVTPITVVPDGED